MHQHAGNRQMAGTAPARPARLHDPGQTRKQHQRHQHADQQQGKGLGKRQTVLGADKTGTPQPDKECGDKKRVEQ